MKKKHKSLLILLLTAMIWGFAFVAQLVGASSVGSFTFNAARFTLGGLSLIPVVLIFERQKTEKSRLRTTILSGMATGIILFAASTLQQLGVMYTGSAGKAGFLTGIYTVIVPIIGIFLKHKTSLNTWMGAVLAVIGLYFISFSEGFSSVGAGDIVLIIGAFMWALHIIVIDIFADRIYSLRFAMIQFIICALLSTICALLFEDISLKSVMEAKFPILYAGVMSVGVAYTCQIIGQKYADPTAASIILSTESIFSALGEAVILGLILTDWDYTPLSPLNYLGCGIIFCSVIISQLNFKKQKLT